VKARTLLTIIVIVASLVALGTFVLAVVDFATKGFQVFRGVGYGAVLLGALAVLRWSARALIGSRIVKEG